MSRNVKILLGVLSAVSLFALGLIVYSIAFGSQSTEDLLVSDWQLLTYGDPPMTIQSPAPLNPITLQLPPQVRRYIDQMHTYAFEEGSDLSIMISTVTYLPEINPDLKGAARGAIVEMRARKGISDVAFKEEPYYLANLTGILQHGTFRHDGDAYDFSNLMFVYNKSLMQMMVSFRSGDEDGQAIRDRLLKSLRISIPS